MLLVDSHNLYRSSIRKHDALIDYNALMEYLNKEYSFRHRYAYVAENEHSSSFANFLRGKGFIVLTKETDSFDVDISIQAIRSLSDLNIKKMVFCTSSKNLGSLFQLLTEQSIDVHVHGVNVHGYNTVFSRELPIRILQKEHALTG